MATSPIVEKLNTMTYGGALGFALILGGLYYFTNYDDGSGIVMATDQIQGEIKIEDEKKKKTQETLQEAAAVKEEVKVLAEKFTTASAKLPSELKTQQLVDMIRSLVQNAGCRLVTIRPMAIEKKPLYDEYPIAVEIRGTYSNLVVFLFYIGAVERITNIRDFSISNVDEGNPGGVLRLEGNIVSYRFRAEAAAAAAATDSKGGT